MNYIKTIFKAFSFLSIAYLLRKELNRQRVVSRTASTPENLANDISPYINFDEIAEKVKPYLKPDNFGV